MGFGGHGYCQNQTLKSLCNNTCMQLKVKSPAHPKVFGFVFRQGVEGGVGGFWRARLLPKSDTYITRQHHLHATQFSL